jgi:hypothetical protein
MEEELKTFSKALFNKFMSTSGQSEPICNMLAEGGFWELRKIRCKIVFNSFDTTTDLLLNSPHHLTSSTGARSLIGSEYLILTLLTVVPLEITGRIHTSKRESQDARLAFPLRRLPNRSRKGDHFSRF